jgi:hypothetical protein
VKTLIRHLRVLLMASLLATLSGCSDPQVYGSIGVSSGYSTYGGWGGPRVHTSVSIGGRIR